MPAPYAHIACCIDDSDVAQRVIAEGRRLRALTPGKLTLLHAAPEPLAYTGLSGEWALDPADISATAQRWVDEQAAAVPGAEAVLVHGYPPVAVCAWAAASGCDLLIAGAHRGLVERMLLGGFAAYLAYHAPCPVLLVRPDTAQPETTSDSAPAEVAT